MKLALDVANKTVHMEGSQCPVSSLQRFISWEELWVMGYSFCERCRAALLTEAKP